MTSESLLEGSSNTTETARQSEVDDTVTPLYFPRETANDDQASQQISFVEACRIAAESHRPLHLSQDIINLSETIVLRKRQRLSIVGISPTSQDLSSLSSSSSSSTNKDKRIQIAGNVHSLFLLNNHSELQLQHLSLVHHEPEGEDCRTVGAAVNLRYKSSADLRDCHIASHAGFCCWAVQKAGMELKDCFLQAPLRSAVVCFGKARFEGRNTRVSNVGVHGVCARGECFIRLVDSTISDAAVRGLYAYANATVVLENCLVKGTVRPDAAAIEVLSSSSAAVAAETTEHNKEQPRGKPNKTTEETQKTSSLHMKGCQILNNGGVGVRIRGGVRHNLDSETSNRFMGNVGGDAVDFLSAQEQEETATNSNQGNEISQSNASNQLKRDDAGSSFRKGDWWCLTCSPKSIVHGSKDSCPRCGSEKENGKLLSSEEVISLNRGNSISASTTTCKVSPKWWFDGDDAGWLPYDTESNQALERAFESFQNPKPSSDAKEKDGRIQPNTVLLSNGRYSVNLETMEQINTESHFLRLVQRRES